MLLKVQLDATFIHCHVTLHVSGVKHPSSGVLKTVSATSGVCHGNGTVTSFHRGLIPQGLLCTKDWFNNRKNFALKFQRSAYWCVNKVWQRLWLCVSSPLGRFFEVLVVHWTSCAQVLCSRKNVKQAGLRFTKTHAMFIGSLSNWIFLMLYKFSSTFKIGYWTSNVIFQTIIFAEEFRIPLP